MSSAVLTYNNIHLATHFLCSTRFLTSKLPSLTCRLHVRDISSFTRAWHILLYSCYHLFCFSMQPASNRVTHPATFWKISIQTTFIIIPVNRGQLDTCYWQCATYCHSRNYHMLKTHHKTCRGSQQIKYKVKIDFMNINQLCDNF